MGNHKAYTMIVRAIQQRLLGEPFTNRDFRRACPGLGAGTYNAFLDKHALGNPGGQTELFARAAPGRFCLLRPFKYGV